MSFIVILMSFQTIYSINYDLTNLSFHKNDFNGLRWVAFFATSHSKSPCDGIVQLLTTKLFTIMMEAWNLTHY